ncbi:hypothetical protein K1T71_007722 [Dendrolimus kikuchii]|uniref:Uncharacterized protein n=1 Tax=Dendrolimus kikuchii TaxID=765133 RepID=A0ACC1CY15_9NEOP|nr:hypothetical protein K1T71_007722 [Dendrolimus kikuchii]
MSCIECRKESKYKCPNCRHPYCSVGCYKKHKVNPCFAPPPPQRENEEIKPDIEYDYPTEDTVPFEKLKLLGQSKEVKQCLENPHVRELLELLDRSSHPDTLIQEYMQEPIFTEFVDACLNVVQTEDNLNHITQND